MIKLLSILLLSICLYAEATFDQVQSTVEPESNWFIWLFGSACISFLFFQFISRRKKSSKLSTPDINPSTKYSPSSSSSWND